MCVDTSYVLFIKFPNVIFYGSRCVKLIIVEVRFLKDLRLILLLEIIATSYLFYCYRQP